MATYKEIQSWVKVNYGWVAKTCWIADCKEQKGLPVKRAANRQTAARMVPCPDNKRDAIFEAFKHFSMIE